jgi:hypothetical protein
MRLPVLTSTGSMGIVRPGLNMRLGARAPFSKAKTQASTRSPLLPSSFPSNLLPTSVTFAHHTITESRMMLPSRLHDPDTTICDDNLRHSRWTERLAPGILVCPHRPQSGPFLQDRLMAFDLTSHMKLSGIFQVFHRYLLPPRLDASTLLVPSRSLPAPQPIQSPPWMKDKEETKYCNQREYETFLNGQPPSALYHDFPSEAQSA